MTFTKFLPVCFMVAMVAAIYVFVANHLTYNVGWTWIALWMPFISWPLYFVIGPKASRLSKQVLGLTGGIILGCITLYIAGLGFLAGLGNYLLPLIVFCVAFIIVLLELTNWFELAPAYFFAYAGYFAYYFGGVGGFSAEGKIVAAMWPVWVLLMVGLILGFFTFAVRKKILEKEGLYGTDQKTVFDKEKT